MKGGHGTARVRTLRLRGEHVARLREWAGAGYPEEVCGALIGGLGEGEARVLEVRRGKNLERERKSDRYVLDPQALLAADRAARAAGREVIGFWHSHPDAEARPSETDRLEAWPGYAYVIVPVAGSTGAGTPRAWWLVDGTFHEGELRG